ncbi:MAG: hypothetical protein ACOY3X_13845 [Pseudomonadota bacterium]
MKIAHVAAAAALIVSGTAMAKDLLTKEQYIDYSAQVKCAEQKYSYSDPDKYEKELDRIEKSFGIKDKDIESGKVDDLAAKYDAEPDTYDAVDAKKASLCPEPL